MKMIFKSEKEKEKFIRRVLANIDGCPEDLGLTDNDRAWCPELNCEKCWMGAFEAVSQVEPLKKFFYTFGTDRGFPLGDKEYVEVHAETWHEADEKFRKNFPNRPGSPYLNCACIYPEGQWRDIYPVYYDGISPTVIIE